MEKGVSVRICSLYARYMMPNRVLLTLQHIHNPVNQQHMRLTNFYRKRIRQGLYRTQNRNAYILRHSLRVTTAGPERTVSEP